MTRRGPILAAATFLAGPACGTTPPPEDPPVCELPSAAARSSSIHDLQCGPTLDFTPINSYQGELAIVQDREDAVVLLNGTCTGTLIAAVAGPVVVTAGHCVGLGDQAVVSFNFEDAPDGDPLITEGTVIEQSTEPDYALLRLAELPAVTPTLLGTQPGDRLAIIQHPRGRPKVVAEGSFLDSCNGLIYYTDLDTLAGSSGAGVLNRQGHLVGVHTDGDCAVDGSGANRGWTAAAIVEASAYLQSADLADR
ncbi:MAG TPA: serine protease [Kofleriaceae bacterium]|nr:serine protease [Kofleriaceae bacterium]